MVENVKYAGIVLDNVPRRTTSISKNCYDHAKKQIITGSFNNPLPLVKSKRYVIVSLIFWIS